MHLYSTAVEAAAALVDSRFVCAEFMYRMRPGDGRERIVFDYALSSRLSALTSQDAVLFICNDQQTIDSLSDFESGFSGLRMVAMIVNPIIDPTFRVPKTAQILGWEHPDSWQRCTMTDRWARIDLALEVASSLMGDGYVIMPAHDAVWGRGLLDSLVRFSQRYARGGLPAAVSPYMYKQHSAVPGADIPPDVIDLFNTALGRDVLFPWKIRFDRVQAFWGKMGVIPFSQCKLIREHVDKSVWEDDLEIDRVIRQLGYGVRCLWVSNPDIYRQALPIFDRDGIRRVIERMLHYSLKIPDERVGGSTLNIPLDMWGKLRAWLSPKFAENNALAEDLIAECAADIASRLKQFGASWVDWGAYRYVVRVGDPLVEVWRQSRHSN